MFPENSESDTIFGEPITHYLNTDLDIVSSLPLADLASKLESLGLAPLHITQGDDSLWYCTLETIKSDHEGPESNIADMLTAIESLPEELIGVWNTCTKREFNVGYNCGEEPWAFNQGLSTGVLRRMAKCGSTFRVTLYPFRRAES